MENLIVGILSTLVFVIIGVIELLKRTLPYAPDWLWVLLAFVLGQVAAWSAYFGGGIDEPLWLIFWIGFAIALAASGTFSWGKTLKGKTDE